MRRTSHAFGAFGFALTLLLLAIASAALAPQAHGSATAPMPQLAAIDGDTLIDRRTGERYRLVNADTPETGDRAHCPAERQLAEQATRRTRALLASARNLDIRRIGRIDSYGRIIARVLVDGRDLGQVLVAEGVARAWSGRREAWCDRQGNLVH